MLKRILSVVFAVLMLNLVCAPAFSYPEAPYGADYPLIIKSEYNTYLNANKASVDQPLQFISKETYKDERTGFIIPKGTIFNGKIRAVSKSKWAFRRAKVSICINEMRFPNGDIYTVNADAKRRYLKGSLLANIVKGVIGTPFAIVAGTAGTCLIIIETVSIIGIASVEPTAKVSGGMIDKFTKGVNYKKHEGSTIKLRINNIKEYDVEKEVQGTIINQDITPPEQEESEDNKNEKQ